MLLDAKEPTDADKHVGRSIRHRRHELGLSQEHLAEKLDITFQQLQKYELGENRVSAGRLYELAKILETRIDYFFRGVEESRAAYTRGVAEGGVDFTPPPNSQAIDLILAFQSIKDPETQKTVLAMVKKAAAEASGRDKPRRKPARKR